MKKRGKSYVVFVLVMIMTSLVSVAQSYDVQWSVGVPIAKIDFRNDTLVTSVLDSSMRTFNTVANICDRNGNLLFWTNGLYIANRTGGLMVNGDWLNSPSIYYSQFTSGMPQSQGVIILPKPGDSTKYYLFHYSPADTSCSLGGYESLNLYYSIVDMSLDNGLGAVTQKNVPIIQDELLSFSRLAACRHANGRDWWIVKNAYSQNKYYTFLLTPDGIQGPFIQTIGPDYGTDNEQPAYSAFSLNGDKYASVAGTSDVVVMDFDRCSGLFSNPISFYNSQLPNPGPNDYSGGLSLAFSPNGRFLYVANLLNLNQYDLSLTPIQDSVRIQTLTYFDDTFHLNIMQLAPNGKIYISTANGGSGKIHTINQPDSFGLACDFHMYSQIVATASPVALPYFPNYKLGALIGSGCDTIPSGIAEVASGAEVRLRPNPASNLVTVLYQPNGDAESKVDVYNSLGELVLSETGQSNAGRVDVDVSKLPTGLYVVRVTMVNTISNSKLIISR